MVVVGPSIRSRVLEKGSRVFVHCVHMESPSKLEYFDIKNQIWIKKEEKTFNIHTTMFSEGAFREAYKAYAVVGEQTLWVVKSSKMKLWKGFQKCME